MTLMPWGQELVTAVHAEPGPSTLVPWGQGLGTPVPRGQLTPGVPASGTPQQGLFGTQTQSTTTRPRAIVPPLCHPRSQLGQQSPSKERPKCWGDTQVLPSPDPTAATFPLNYLRERLHVGQSAKQTSSQPTRCQRPTSGLLYGATITTWRTLPSPSQHDATSGLSASRPNPPPWHLPPHF